ncbi:MAG: S1 RNA-binding domain-containing protein [Candidatus Gastranaerophilales bacterium]|nr:S1 RNA-binding domain-containing protein [Candidatus Gastranaerophilales bacterium]
MSPTKQEQSEFEKLLSKYDYDFKKGNLVKGIVVGYESNNVLVDIGAKTSAIIPFREVSLSAGKPSKEVLEVGDEKEFLIIKDEDEEGQLTLSYKKVAAAYSWQKIENIKKDDQSVEGEVLSVVKGGLLVEVMGLRGFVPSSHLRAKDPDNLIGEKLELKILSFDSVQGNLILSHRKVTTDQQAEKKKEIFETLKAGSVVEGEVVRLAEFGAFIDIGGIDGLLPLSQVSWRWVDHPSDVLSIGQIIKVEVIGIDHDKERVSLSLKNLQPDPWDKAREIIKENEKITGIITRLKHFGAFVEVCDGVEALLPQKEVNELQIRKKAPVEVGDKIEATVLKFTPADKRISLSVSEQPREEEKPETTVKQKKQKSEIPE